MTDTFDEKARELIPDLSPCITDQTGYLTEMRDKIAQALREAAGEWQPIETAPRDGITVWGYAWKQGYRGMVSWNGAEWELVDEFTNLPNGVGFYPTHWRPLPQPPED